MSSKIVMIGAGVANVNAATKLMKVLMVKLPLLIWVKIPIEDHMKK